MPRKNCRAAALYALSAVLAGCGEGGGISSVSSTAPPVPDPNAHSVGYSFTALSPLALAPAWTSGTYQAIGVIGESADQTSYSKLPAGGASITVDTAAKTYSLTLAVGSVRVAPQSFKVPTLTDPTTNTDWSSSFIGYTVKSVIRWSDGVTRPGQDGTGDATLGQYSKYGQRVTTADGERSRDSFLSVSSAPGRHVSLGSWDIYDSPINPDGSQGTPGVRSTGFFAFGDRTAPADIPVSGTAHFAVDTPAVDPYDSTRPIRSTSFDVDFSARTIAASLAGSLALSLYSEGGLCCFGWEEYVPQGTVVGTVTATTKASGTAPFTTSGSFDIALAGNSLVQTKRTDNKVVPDVVQAVTGSISGAFFGPKATELGGTFNLPGLWPNGPDSNQAGAFTAIQTAP